jgi:hypothetical protein
MSAQVSDRLQIIEHQSWAARSALESLLGPMGVMELFIAQNTMTADMTAQTQAIQRLLRTSSVSDYIAIQSQAVERLTTSMHFSWKHF